MLNAIADRREEATGSSKSAGAAWNTCTAGFLLLPAASSVLRRKLVQIQGFSCSVQLFTHVLLFTAPGAPPVHASWHWGFAWPMGCVSSKPEVCANAPQQPPPASSSARGRHHRTCVRPGPCPFVQAATENARQLDADDNNHAELESTKAPEGLPPIVTVPAAADAPPAPGALPAPPRSARLPPRAVCLPPSPFSYQAAQPAAALQAGPKPEPPAAPLPPTEAAAAHAQPPGSEAAPAAVAPAEPPCVEVVVAAAAAEPPDAGAEVAAAVTADHTGAYSHAAVGGAAAEPSGTDIGAAAAAAAATMVFSAQADGGCGGAEHYGIPPADEIIMHSEWHEAHVQWRVLAAIRMGAAMQELESL